MDCWHAKLSTVTLQVDDDMKCTADTRNCLQWHCRHRRTRRGVRGGSWPPNSGRYMTFIRAKDNTFVWLTVSPRTEQVSIYLRYISGGVTKETFIGYSLRPSKIGTSKVRYYFFLPGGAAWQTSCVRHSGKTRFDPPKGCWPVRLWLQVDDDMKCTADMRNCLKWHCR